MNIPDAVYERDPEWAAPMLWRGEFRNILAGYLRRGAISIAQATDLQREAEGLMAGREFEAESESVLELVRNSDAPRTTANSLPWQRNSTPS